MGKQSSNYQEIGENLLNEIIATTSIKSLYQALYQGSEKDKPELIREAILGDELPKIALNSDYSPYLQAIQFKENSIYTVDYSEEAIAFAIENLILGFIQNHYESLPLDDIDRLVFRGVLTSFKREYYETRMMRMSGEPEFNHGMRQLRIK